jgi:sterol desaturase/sphingolipid hydroxylase (fatty acid hydroxylase superfamily)
VPEANQLDRLGMLLAGNLAIFYVGFFIAFAVLEAAFSKGRDPGSAAHGRLVVNFSLPIASGLVALIVPFGVTTSAFLAEQQQWGLFHQIDAPPLIVLIAAMLSRTGLGYLVHRLSHAVPWLWRLHKVHHSDPHVDISLSLRHHPLELIPGLLAFSAGTLLLGLPVWSVALVEAVLIAASYSDHLDVRLPSRAARWLRFLFVTPEVHHVHHSAARAQTDSNYGSLLICWDRLFGTYREPETEIVRRYGLDEIDAGQANSLWAQLALPFARCARPAGESRN